MVNRKSSKNKSRKNKKTMKKMYSKMSKREKKRLLRTIKKIKIFHKKSKSKKKKATKKVKKVMKGGSVPFDEVWRLPATVGFAGSAALKTVSNEPVGAPDNVEEPVNPQPTSNPHVSLDSNIVGGADLGKILTEYNA